MGARLPFPGRLDGGTWEVAARRCQAGSWGVWQLSRPAWAEKVREAESDCEKHSSRAGITTSETLCQTTSFTQVSSYLSAILTAFCPFLGGAPSRNVSRVQ